MLTEMESLRMSTSPLCKSCNEPLSGHEIGRRLDVCVAKVMGPCDPCNNNVRVKIISLTKGVVLDDKGERL